MGLQITSNKCLTGQDRPIIISVTNDYNELAQELQFYQSFTVILNCHCSQVFAHALLSPLGDWRLCAMLWTQLSLLIVLKSTFYHSSEPVHHTPNWWLCWLLERAAQGPCKPTLSVSTRMASIITSVENAKNGENSPDICIQVRHSALQIEE